MIVKLLFLRATEQSKRRHGPAVGTTHAACVSGRARRYYQTEVKKRGRRGPIFFSEGGEKNGDFRQSNGAAPADPEDAARCLFCFVNWLCFAFCGAGGIFYHGRTKRRHGAKYDAGTACTGNGGAAASTTSLYRRDFLRLRMLPYL